ncbi:uncharacterized protein LOC142582079 [Dermacentor variabilis]|uniref:uncharacterized protein LOC142582079 n=1 Tax=Dermacentor variabilis TaxID=34621 RepID=UPI003F5C52BF
MELLSPYLHDLQVNGKPSRVLRDSAATMDIVHPSYVTVDDFTGEVAWIKQVVEEHSVYLPMAKVKISGPFGVLETEAAVSKFLSLQYPYIFSNRSNQLLRDKGLKLGEGIVQALTRGQARKIASLLAENAQAPPAETEKGITSIPESELGSSDEKTVEESLPADQFNEGVALECQSSSLQEEQADALTSETGSLLSPAPKNYDQLLCAERESLAAEQKNDKNSAKLHDSAKEGIARRNVTIHDKGGLLYRHYRYRKGRILDQLVVPTKYREDLLSLCHGNGWSGHLGIHKSKERLLMEYYWPGCPKDVENFVRSCDACQRSGKPGETWKAPLKVVPLITEPFRRLVIDMVGPLPKTKSGYRYLFTMLCPATKFPEAIPLKERSSTEVVDALLTVFARVGFPVEIQADQGCMTPPLASSDRSSAAVGSSGQQPVMSGGLLAVLLTAAHVALPPPDLRRKKRKTLYGR